MEFTSQEKNIIERLKQLRALDCDSYVSGKLKIRVMNEIINFKPSFGFWAYNFYARYAAAFGVVFILFMGATIVWASTFSLPNDKLYPVKVMVENAQILLENNPTKKAALEAKFAKERVQELQVLTKISSDPKVASETVDRYKERINRVRQNINAIASKPAVGQSNKISENNLKEVEEIIKNLSNTTLVLINEAEKQIAENSSATDTKELTQKFVEAAQESTAVLSEVVERLNEQSSE
jgi:hypothetical protein